MDQPDTSPAASSGQTLEAQAASAPKRAGWLRRATLSLIAGAVTLAGVLALLLLVLLLPAGTRLALGLVPGLHVVQPKGSLLRNFTAQKVEFDGAGAAGLPSVKIEDLAWLGFRFERVGEASSGWGVKLDTLSARHVVVDLPPSQTSSEPATLPASLALPLGVSLGDIRIGSLQLSVLGAEPITDIRARLSAQHRVGKSVQHRVDGLSLHWRHWSASGSLGLAAQSPFGLDASLALQSDTALQALPGNADEPDHGVQARFKLGGTLAHVTAQAEAQARRQRLQAAAELAPFVDWPVQRIEVSAQDFDLALLDPRAPQTRLSGRLSLHPPPSQVTQTTGLVGPPQAGGDEPMLDVQSAWRNDVAGRWSDGRLPIRAVQWAGQLSARDGLKGALKQLSIELGSSNQAGGRLQSSGQWNVRPCADRAACAQAGPAWTLSSTLDRLRLATLDAAAPPLIVSGPLNLRGDAPLSTRLNISTELTGRVDAQGPQRSVVLKVEADATPDDIEVRTLQAQAGLASLALSGSARQQNGQWRVRSKGQWSRFDPQLWWPAWFAEASGAAGGAAAASSNELNGQLDADLTWRQAASATGPRDAIASALYALGGEATVVLEDSRLRGVPVAARAALRTQVKSAATTVEASLDVAGNRLSVQGAMDYTRPAQDHWSAVLDMGDLRRLAPVARLLGLDQIKGAVDGQLHATGRWPAITSEGVVHVKGLALAWQAGGHDLHQLELDRLSTDWRWGPAWASSSAPIQTKVELDGMQVGVWRLDRLSAATTGTVSDHHASLALDVVLPPGLATSLQPVLKRKNAELPLKVSGLIEMQGQGALDGRRPAWSWRGQWQRVVVQPEPDSVLGNTLGGQPWLQIQPFETTLAHDASHTEFRSSAVRLTVAGAAAAVRQLHWAGARDGVAGPGAVDVELDVEPIQVARVLAALQPDMGWSGDLTLGGSLRLHREAGAHAPLSLDAEVARRGGDLALTDAAVEGGAVQQLRLDALRVGLSAHAGVWRLEQQLGGRRLGALNGRQTVTTDPADLLPSPHAPLDGQLDVDVANLRLWGLWVPAGWRLSGQLQGRTTFKGTLDQPLVSGYLKGHQLGVRNMLQGVDFEQGELDFEMDASQARLNRFTLRAGQGDLTLTGDARLDVSPEAHLRLVLQQFAVLQRIDRRLVVSGQSDLSLLADSLNVQGAFGVDEGLFDISKSGAPTLDDDVRRAGVDDVVIDPADESAKAHKSPYKINLDMLLDLGSKLRLRGYGLDTKLVGKLKMTSGPPSYKPAVRGTIKTQDGTFAAYGQKLVIDRGAVNFTGPMDNPSLDIEATRPQSRMASSASLTATASDTDVRVGVAITGTAQNPRIRLFSDPEMSETDKLSWLVLGHAANGLAGADLALLQGAASALMGGDSTGVNDGLIQSLGLDEMSVRQSDDGTQDTVVTVGKQISKRWYVGYERGLNATAGTWQLIYRLAQRFTLRAQSGLDNSLDFIWVWRWD